MKRIVLLIGIVLIVYGLSSCTKENVLSGTKWLGGADGISAELRFTETEFELNAIALNEYILGSYVYEAPNITFIATKWIDSSGIVRYADGSFTGVVDGKTLTANMEGAIVKFIKQ